MSQTITDAVAGTQVTSDADAVALVARLRATARSGRTRRLTWRRRQLEALIQLCQENEQAIADALAADLGRLPSEAYLADNGGIQLEARHALAHLETWARPQRHRLSLSALPARAWTEFEPLGTVLVIGPWNYPVYLTLAPLVGVLAAGNCAILKPSELTPATSDLIARLVERYLDTEAIAVVQGEAEATQSLIAADVDHVMFTGSAGVARHVMRAAADTLTPVTLELGGKCPAIVAADADLRVAARRIVWAKLNNSGQTCITVDHVLVHRKVRDDFLRVLVDTFDDFWSNREDPALDGQRVINDRHHARLMGLLGDHGGQVLRGGRGNADALTIEPTIIADPSPVSALMSEEIFGPILPVLTVDSVAGAVEYVADRPHPLAVALFSDDRVAHRQVIDGISTGGVVINHVGLHCLSPQLPFGGVGSSGIGVYHGRWGFETFSHRKPVLRKWTRPDPPIMYPPVRAWKTALLRRLL